MTGSIHCLLQSHSGGWICLQACTAVMLLLLLLQLLMIKELFHLARVAQKDLKLPGFRAQQWYFFFVATFYLYLR
jgi:CDP-diglyceride synthetase